LVVRTFDVAGLLLERVSTLRVTRLLLVLVLAVLSAGAVSACGVDEEAERAAAQARAKAARQREKAAQDRRDQAELKRLVAEHQEKVAAARALATGCDRQLGELVEAVGELDSRLDIGMTYSDYTSEVSDLKVSYDSIDWDLDDELEPEDTLTCINEVGLPAEKALNEYAKATRIWGECMDDLYCSNDSIEPSLQRRWRRASSNADNATDALDELQDAVAALEREEPTIEDVTSESAPPEDEPFTPEREDGTVS
jgi:hypothetical protein